MFELQPGGVPLTPETLLGRVIHAFQPELKLPDALEELQAIYRSLLAGRRGLLLLDNARERQAGPAAAAAAGRLGGHRDLAAAAFGWTAASCTKWSCCRSRCAGPCSRGCCPTADGKTSTGADLGPLAERCGRLPLALRLAAGYLTSTRAPAPDLPGATSSAARLKYLKDPEGEQSVRAVLGLSVDQLSERSRGPGAALARPGGLPGAV